MSVWRWLVVLIGVAVLGALPAAIGSLPVQQSSISAADLLSRVMHSRTVGYSGYAESEGGLALPVTRQFSSVGDLFGDTTRLRVWWRDQFDWRVDTIGVTGESDVHATPTGSWTWNYEFGIATWMRAEKPPAVRLPAAGDLLPTTLAQRLLSQAQPGEARRLPARRVAGHSAPGLRLVPRAPESTITHVDVWADRATGLALQVQVYGEGAPGPVLTTRFLDFSAHTPAAATTAFSPPPGARIRNQELPDIAALIDQFGGTLPPRRLAGLARNSSLPPFGAIGVYGAGVTELAAVPLPDRLADSIHRELVGSAVKSPAGLAMTIGPLNLLLARPDRFGTSWLLTGTVTAKTLSTAATELARALQ